MPFYYDLKAPDLDAGSALLERLLPEGVFVEPNTGFALLIVGKNKTMLRVTGRGRLAAWYVQIGEPIETGQALARMEADGEDIPYGRPYVIAESGEGCERPRSLAGIRALSLGGNWMFPGVEGLSRKRVFQWWEARRVSYNVLVGLVGIVTWFLVIFAGSAAVKPGEDFEEPIVMIVGPVLYGILANLCYSCGPLFDVTFYSGRPRVNLLRAGLIFSLILTAAPGIWAVIAWLITIYTGKKVGLRLFIGSQN